MTSILKISVTFILSFVLGLSALSASYSADYRQYFEVHGSGKLNKFQFACRDPAVTNLWCIDESSGYNLLGSISGPIIARFQYDPFLFAQYPNGYATSSGCLNAGLGRPYVFLLSLYLNGIDITPLFNNLDYATGETIFKPSGPCVTKGDEYVISNAGVGKSLYSYISGGYLISDKSIPDFFYDSSYNGESILALQMDFQALVLENGSLKLGGGSGGGGNFYVSMFPESSRSAVWYGHRYTFDYNITSTNLVTPPKEVPTAANEKAVTSANVPLSIDLTKGASGSPRAAALAGTANHGTLTGLPGTTVVFTPSANFTGTATFSFTLSNEVGTSKQALATIIVAPSLVANNKKLIFSSIGSSCKDVSDAFDHASIVAEGPKNLLRNVGLHVMQKVAVEAITEDDKLSGQAMDFMSNASSFAAFSIKRLTKTNVISIPLEIDSLIFGLCSLSANVIASDPPDSNYKQVFLPQKLSIPVNANSTITKIENDYLQYLSVSAAALHAAERWQGATLARDTTSASAQNGAYLKYSLQASNLKDILKADNKILATLPTARIDSFPGGAKAIASAYNSLCGAPLPADINAKLLALPLTQADINKRVCDYVLQIGPVVITTDFATPLSKTNPQ